MAVTGRCRPTRCNSRSRTHNAAQRKIGELFLEGQGRGSAVGRPCRSRPGTQRDATPGRRPGIGITPSRGTIAILLHQSS